MNMEKDTYQKSGTSVIFQKEILIEGMLRPYEKGINSRLVSIKN